MAFFNSYNLLYFWIFTLSWAVIWAMGLLSNSPAAVLLLAFALLTCLHMNHVSNHDSSLVRSVCAKPNKSKAHERFVNEAEPQSSSEETRTDRTDVSTDIKCTMAPESRFDCARDRLLSQEECEERGCCYAPLPNSTGPPWCFYPSLYPGYEMGPLTPSTRGQAATLTRATPSYLPKDVSSLQLEVIEETAGCLHLTVSAHHSDLSCAFKKT